MFEHTEPQLVGYFPKRITPRPEWLKVENVVEICSVATCMSAAPDDWIEKWLHNQLGLFDTVELAWKIVPKSERTGYNLFAYKLFPIVFREGRPEPFEPPLLSVEPLTRRWERLGYDAASKSDSFFFEHSPLSCNHLASEFPVNRWCLVDVVDTAFKMPALFEKEQCEPGPYYVLEVWRHITSS